ncbi:glycoside hydrolase family 3 N-terminal domain-containing protein [uncultured Cellulomonas sp.]|uniref:glycoside hydrolase family 3 N-terminal domain-containing protein n=1 Tax=uncultured Cellulomonas sp. TaxID=189682 RepID=UPI002637B19D|nr:glycoside hydrolase family 3 N-terminal domain-containing protein [uncultured Cellulomonas sp.]
MAGLLAAACLVGCTTVPGGATGHPGRAAPPGDAATSAGSGVGTPPPSPAPSPAPGPPSTGPTSGGSPAPTHSPATPPPASPPADPLAGWTVEQQVAQVLMVGVRTSAPQQLSHDLVADGTVANVFLQGRTEAGRVRVGNLVRWFTDDLPAGPGHGRPLLVATDQEGGQVQVLRGQGFSDIPTAVQQGRTEPAALRSSATGWGRELAAVGVTVDLAPVVDLPTPAGAAANAPVGHDDRQYGFTVDDVVTHASAFAAGMADAGVHTVIKHFPGLGRVTGNTDAVDGVTDTTTDAGSDQVAVVRRMVDDGVWGVMVSTADYALLDPGVPAAFSPVVVGDLLRGDLGFDGLVVTDDLSGAAQVAGWTPGERAVLAVAAGCDLVLASEVPQVAPEMAQALSARARTDPEFAARLADAVRHVLAAKAATA